MSDFISLNHRQTIPNIITKSTFSNNNFKRLTLNTQQLHFMSCLKNEAHTIQRKTWLKQLKYSAPTNNFLLSKCQARMYFCQYLPGNDPGELPRNLPSLTSPLSHPHEEAAGPYCWTLEHPLQERWPSSDPLGAGGATCIRSIQCEEKILIVLPCLHHTLKERGREVAPSLGPHPALFPGREHL